MCLGQAKKLAFSKNTHWPLVTRNMYMDCHKIYFDLVLDWSLKISQGSWLSVCLLPLDATDIRHSGTALTISLKISIGYFKELLRFWKNLMHFLERLPYTIPTLIYAAIHGSVNYFKLVFISIYIIYEFLLLSIIECHIRVYYRDL